MLYPVYFVRVYQPLMESLKREKNCIENLATMVHRKICMACIEPYMVLGYDCQQKLTRGETIIDAFFHQKLQPFQETNKHPCIRELSDKPRNWYFV